MSVDNQLDTKFLNDFHRKNFVSSISYDIFVSASDIMGADITDSEI